MALAAKLNTTHGKRLTVLELATRIKLLVEENGWSQGKAAAYFNKNRTWVNHYIGIANNLNTTLVTRVTPLDYGSARELAKLPQNKQEQAYRMARKMAIHDRKLAPSARLMAKVVKKIREDPPKETDLINEGPDQEEKRWLKLTTCWNFNSCDPRFGFQYPGRIPGQVVLNILY
ncbi:MAG: hypothetical protein C0407_19555, partial [Desulfobacca sp.]|nr:hypothetical protein [Desulfobacca sp.]